MLSLGIAFAAFVTAILFLIAKDEYQYWDLTMSVIFYSCWFIFGFALAFGAVKVFFL